MLVFLFLLFFYNFGSRSGKFVLFSKILVEFPFLEKYYYYCFIFSVYV